MGQRETNSKTVGLNPSALRKVITLRGPGAGERGGRNCYLVGTVSVWEDETVLQVAVVTAAQQ